jgi:hypothetical protein
VAREVGPGSRVGRYRLLNVLGSGGMGCVYLGKTVGGQMAAVKVIRENLAADPEFRVRFGREVAAARQVSGLYTATVIDADLQGPVLWLATTYISGPSLAKAVDNGGLMPLASLRMLAAGLAEGLSAIHAAGLVHRDLKPSNVLLADNGPKIIDFGISRSLQDTALTTPGGVIGTPEFMSPEQAEHGNAGTASDVFSLGAVLYYAATGRTPFGSGDARALLYRVAHAEPDLEGIPDEIRDLVARCLNKDPGQRPAVAQILSQMGEARLTGERLPSTVTDRAAREVPQASTVSRETAVPEADVRPRYDPRRRPPPGLAATLTGLVVVLALLSVPAVVIVTRNATRPAGNPVVYDGKRYGFDLPAAMAADANHIWVVDGLGGYVDRIDARTGAFAGALSSDHISDPYAIADDSKHLWVGNSGGVAEFSVTSGKWIRTIPYVGECDPFAFLGPGSLDTPNYSLPMIVAGRLWISNYGCTDRVDIYDINSGRLLDSISSSSDGFEDMTAMVSDGLHAWGAATSSQCSDCSVLVEFDSANGRFVRALPAGQYDLTWPDGIAMYGNRIWMLGNGVAYEADSRTQKINRTLSGDYDFGISGAVGDSGQNGNDRIVRYGGHIFTVDGQDNDVIELDAATGMVVHKFSGTAYGFSHPVALALVGNHIWVLSNGNGTSNGGLTELTVGLPEFRVSEEATGNVLDLPRPAPRGSRDVDRPIRTRTLVRA